VRQVTGRRNGEKSYKNNFFMLECPIVEKGKKALIETSMACFDSITNDRTGDISSTVRVYPKAGVLIKFSSFLGFFELYRLPSNTQFREKEFFSTFWGSLRFLVFF
jgi:hypothetical protein